jgi:hypothetical protein
MTNTPETIVINGTKEATEAIREMIDAQPGSESHMTERKNLDGNTAAWIVIATLAGQTLPHVLSFIKDYLTTKQVKKIKVGDWEVESPTPEIVERFIAMMDAQSKQEKSSG